MLAGIGVGFGLGEAFEAFKEAEQSSAKLTAVITATGNAAGFTADQLSQYATDLQNVTTFEDDATVGAMAVLASFTNIKGDIFKEAVVSAQDLSTVMGTDLQSSVVLIGKALNDPIKGMKALRKVGVAFTESQISQITALREAGDMMGAQRVILAELQKEFGGAAKAVGETFSGKVDQAKNALGNLAETIIGTAAPAIASIADAAKNAAEWVAKHGSELRTAVKVTIAAVAAVTAYKVALWSIVAAQRAVAIASAIASGAQGPAGWAKLAVGAAVTATALYGVNKAFDSIDTSGSGAAHTVSNGMAHAAAMTAELGDEADETESAIGNIGKTAKKSIKEFEKLLSTIHDNFSDMKIQAANPDATKDQLDHQKTLIELADRQAEANRRIKQSQANLNAAKATGQQSQIDVATREADDAAAHAAFVIIARDELERTKVLQAQVDAVKAQTDAYEDLQKSAASAIEGTLNSTDKLRKSMEEIARMSESGLLTSNQEQRLIDKAVEDSGEVERVLREHNNFANRQKTATFKLPSIAAREQVHTLGSGRGPDKTALDRIAKNSEKQIKEAQRQTKAIDNIDLEIVMAEF